MNTNLENEYVQAFFEAGSEAFSCPRGGLAMVLAAIRAGLSRVELFWLLPPLMGEALRATVDLAFTCSHRGCSFDSACFRGGPRLSTAGRNRRVELPSA